MALELKFKYEISSDRTQLIITDDTGVYDVNNTTGWGTPNTNRAAVGLYCYVSYQPYNKDLEVLTPIGTDFDINPTFPNSYQSTFVYPYEKDGWYRILLVAMTQVEYDAITNPEDLITDDDYPHIFSEDIIMVNLMVQKNCLLESYFACLECHSCKCDDKKEELLKLNLSIQATDYRFYSQKQFEAQKMLEQLTKQYKCCK